VCVWLCVCVCVYRCGVTSTCCNMWRASCISIKVTASPARPTIRWCSGEGVAPPRTLACAAAHRLCSETLHTRSRQHEPGWEPRECICGVRLESCLPRHDRGIHAHGEPLGRYRACELAQPTSEENLRCAHRVSVAECRVVCDALWLLVCVATTLPQCCELKILLGRVPSERCRSCAISC